MNFLPPPPSPSQPPLLVIVGPTAVGKTTLSLQLAADFDGEIVSADSRLFYQGMNIGTAKPTAAERARVPHHLIDICPPNQTLTLAQYQRRAYQTINDIQRRDRRPILVGGTGQYVKAVVEGWGIPEVPPNKRLRLALANLEGPELARWLQQLDPAATTAIDPRNVRRVIRALEVTLITGRPISELQRKRPPPYDIVMIGLTCDRPFLYERIDRRVDEMMNQGLLVELEELRDAGYGRELSAMSGLGYRQLWAFLAGECLLSEAVQRIKFDTHRFARQQATWFRPGDPSITWFDIQQLDWAAAAHQHVRQWLQTRTVR